MEDFSFVIMVFLPQRRSPGILARELNKNGHVFRSKYFLPGVGQCTRIHCNHAGKKIVEKRMGCQLDWRIQPYESRMA